MRVTKGDLDAIRARAAARRDPTGMPLLAAQQREADADMETLIDEVRRLRRLLLHAHDPNRNDELEAEIYTIHAEGP